jgi:hypothetical protein
MKLYIQHIIHIQNVLGYYVYERRKNLHHNFYLKKKRRFKKKKEKKNGNLYKIFQMAEHI